MEVLNKNLSFIILVLLIISCSHEVYITDDDFSMMMADYYNDHLKYPKNGKDYCRGIYIYDSINGFSYINGFAEENDEAQVTHYNYDEYNSTMNSLLWKTWTEGRVSTPMVWYYIYENQNNIVFKESDSTLMMINNKTNDTFVTKKYHTLTDKMCINQLDFSQYRNFEMKIIAEPLYLKFYNNDSIRIMSEKMEEENKKKIYALISSDSICESQSNKINILQYSHETAFKSCVSNDDINDKMNDNKSLMHFLDSLIDSDSRIRFVTFGLRQ